jgi:hypothetical protein
MPYLENLTCGAEECHFNHANYCYKETVSLDIAATCEDFENCDDYECQDCEFYDFCTKDKKFSSNTFGEESFYDDIEKY